ncbi:MAG: hypothetical protein EON56_02075 [Alphaproteobacteria bacterium]|nr:MAG: hypothetical protein EON56_02075 [Alphaproteobacteria bacterium]
MAGLSWASGPDFGEHMTPTSGILEGEALAPPAPAASGDAIPHLALDATSPSRLFFMDAARALLMFLGIPYHTAMAYSYLTHWTIKSEDTSFLLSWFAALTHAFRMPAFFIIAGFFSALILRKRGPLNWLSYRTPRLLVPLLTVCLPA